VVSQAYYVVFIIISDNSDQIGKVKANIDGFGFGGSSSRCFISLIIASELPRPYLLGTHITFMLDIVGDGAGPELFGDPSQRSSVLDFLVKCLSKTQIPQTLMLVLSLRLRWWAALI
jgi:hypothetical protein